MSFDIKDNDIYFENRLFAVIVAHGPASFGWESDARAKLVENNYLQNLVNIRELIMDIKDNFPLNIIRHRATYNALCDLRDLPEGQEYNEEEKKATDVLSWHISPQMRYLFNIVLEVHLRRQRAEICAMLDNLYNTIEETLS